MQQITRRDYHICIKNPGLNFNHPPLGVLTMSCTTLATLFAVCSGRSQTAPPETAVREKLAILEEDEPEAPLSKVLLAIRPSFPLLVLIGKGANHQPGWPLSLWHI